MKTRKNNINELKNGFSYGDIISPPPSIEFSFPDLTVYETSSRYADTQSVMIYSELIMRTKGAHLALISAEVFVGNGYGVSKGIKVSLQILHFDNYGYLIPSEVVYENSIDGEYDLKLVRMGSSDYSVRITQGGVNYIGHVGLKNIVVKLI